METNDNKRQLGIRIPRELDGKLENHVKKIGISKQAFILNLIFRELEKNSQPHDADNKELFQ